MKKKYVGIHDHPDHAPRWVDAKTSYTWLRAFERTEGIQPVAYVREYNYDYDVREAVNGVFYRFRRSGMQLWVDDIAKESPDVILHNVCFYSEGAPAIQRLKERVPAAVHVIRIHHQVRYLAAQPGFREFLLACDVAIAPTPEQVLDVRRLGFLGPIYSLPFGINVEPLKAHALPFGERDIQLASASNAHPARNLEIVEAVYKELRLRGRRVENFQGLLPEAFSKALGRTKIFWQTALTEASGSRVLPEALAAGCFPVVFDECSSTREFIEIHKTGRGIRSGIYYDFPTKKAYAPANVVDMLVDRLDSLIEELDGGGDYSAPNVSIFYDERYEISALSDILKSSEARQSSPRFKQCWQLNLPCDVGGYAFNPTIARTAAGLLCIYRHVGLDRTRTLRRCLLGQDFSVSEYAIWSEEVGALTGEAQWYADPRIFSAGDDLFVSFNSGHSESPNNIYLVKIRPDGTPLTSPVRLVKQDGRRDIEKNWGFFGYEGRVYAIYSLAPFIVLEVEFREGGAYTKTMYEYEWDASGYEERFGELHGGASPLAYGNHFYFFVQSNTRTVDGLMYRGALLKFELRPPFRPVAISRLPLFTLTVDESQLIPEEKLNASVALCLYPGGVVCSGEDVVLVYGVNDYRAGAREYPLQELERFLQPIL